jgi:hypothetical protein
MTEKGGKIGASMHWMGKIMQQELFPEFLFFVNIQAMYWQESEDNRISFLQII